MMRKKKWIALEDGGQEYAFEIGDHYDMFYKGQPIRFDISEQPDGFLAVSAFGVRYPVEILSRHQNYCQVLINGVQYSFNLETPFSLNRKKILAALPGIGSRKNVIKAPMPGKISRLLVAVGQEVKLGETLLVLDAMKMQNSITCHRAGKVTRVWIQEGQNVSKDERLMEIE